MMARRTVNRPSESIGQQDALARAALSAASRGISIVGLSKRFRRHGSDEEVLAIDNISLEVAEGELVVLLGPSGCGKTTLLRCVAGLEHPDLGEVRAGSQVLFSSASGINVPVNRRNVSVIFQGYALWPHMTVYENVAYPLRSGHRRHDKSFVADKVNGVLALVGLVGLGGVYPGTLSGGQQQRVSLARALVADPAVIVFDEPLSSVDAQIRRDLRREIQAMHRRVGFTALYVTHDQEEALSLADRIAVLQRGRIVQYGEPRDVYDAPNSRYVADFVGRANILSGQLRPGPGRTTLAESEVGTLVAQFPESGIPQSDPDDAYVLVRPTDLQIVGHDATQEQVGRAFDATVTSIEFLGTRLEVSLRTTRDTPLIVECDRTRPIPHIGDQVSVAVRTAEVRVVFE
jgi:iron(III) transport system ATP-binding protein